MHIHSDTRKATKKDGIFHGCFEYLPHFCWNVHNFYLWLLSFVHSCSARTILFLFFLCFWWLEVIAFYSGSFSFGLVCLFFGVSFWNFVNFDGEKCFWERTCKGKNKTTSTTRTQPFVGCKRWDTFRIYGHGYNFCVFSYCPLKKRSAVNEPNKKVILAFVWFHLHNQPTDHRCVIFFAFILLHLPTAHTTHNTNNKNDKAHWRRKRFVLWSRFINLIIFSFRSNRLGVCVRFLSQLFYWYCLDFFSSLFFRYSSFCWPWLQPRSISNSKGRRRKKNSRAKERGKLNWWNLSANNSRCATRSP